ncbi:MAG: hypothetical protein PVI30_25205 [Myxococcales bacterium]
MMFWRFASCMCLLLAGACAGGSETGNPAIPVGLSLRSSDPDAVALSSGAAGTVIDEAWVAFGPFDFVTGTACEQLDERGQMGPTLVVADLASPSVQITIDVQAQTYCGLVVPLERFTAELPDAAPGALADHSIVVRGTTAGGTPFAIEWPEQDELELAGEGEGDFEVREGDRLIFAFDVATWLDGVDLDAAAVDDDGVIRVGAGSNVAQLQAFEANVECSLRLYRDEDADGALDADDTTIASCIAD